MLPSRCGALIRRDALVSRTQAVAAVKHRRDSQWELQVENESSPI